MTTLTLAPNEKDPRRITDVVRQLCEGRSNATGTVTLAANAVTTTVEAPSAAVGSTVQLTPATADAAADFATTYVLASNITQGQFIVSHANKATTDRIFFFEVRG
jgi:hypothetical protein